MRDYVWKFCGGPEKAPRFPKWSDLGKFIPKGDEFDFWITTRYKTEERGFFLQEARAWTEVLFVQDH